MQFVFKFYSNNFKISKIMQILNKNLRTLPEEKDRKEGKR